MDGAIKEFTNIDINTITHESTQYNKNFSDLQLNDMDCNNVKLSQLTVMNNNTITDSVNQISCKPHRTKFKTISERETINTDANINTGTDDTDDSVGSGVSEPPCNIHEFSISTLDRKLKQLRQIKKDSKMKVRKPRHQSVSFSDTDKENYTYDNPKTQMNSSHQFNTNRMNNVTIMMNPSKLINEHMSEIQLRIIGHTRAAISYEKKEKIIGYPVTILSSFLTSAIMMSISGDSDSDKDVIKYISLTLSITSFLFSVSRDYLNFARKFQSHDLSSKLYTTLLRSVEVRLINSHLDKDEKRDIFKDIVDQMSIIEQYEIPVPSSIDSNVRRDHIEMME
jgi:hypothetical protein